MSPWVALVAGADGTEVGVDAGGRGWISAAVTSQLPSVAGWSMGPRARAPVPSGWQVEASRLSAPASFPTTPTAWPWLCPCGETTDHPCVAGGTARGRPAGPARLAVPHERCRDVHEACSRAGADAEPAGAGEDVGRGRRRRDAGPSRGPGSARPPRRARPGRVGRRREGGAAPDRPARIVGRRVGDPSARTSPVRESVAGRR